MYDGTLYDKPLPLPLPDRHMTEERKKILANRKKNWMAGLRPLKNEVAPASQSWVQFDDLCSFCGEDGAQHLRYDCPALKSQKAAHTSQDPRSWTNPLCSYPPCVTKPTHLTKACYALHAVCSRCRFRGHKRQHCSLAPTALFERLFHIWSPLGALTSNNDPKSRFLFRGAK